MSIFCCKSILRIGGFYFGIGCALPSFLIRVSYGDLGVLGLDGATGTCNYTFLVDVFLLISELGPVKFFK